MGILLYWAPRLGPRFSATSDRRSGSVRAACRHRAPPDLANRESRLLGLPPRAGLADRVGPNARQRRPQAIQPATDLLGDRRLGLLHKSILSAADGSSRPRGIRRSMREMAVGRARRPPWQKMTTWGWPASASSISSIRFSTVAPGCRGSARTNVVRIWSRPRCFEGRERGAA